MAKDVVRFQKRLFKSPVLIIGYAIDRCELIVHLRAPPKYQSRYQWKPSKHQFFLVKVAHFKAFGENWQLLVSTFHTTFSVKNFILRKVVFSSALFSEENDSIHDRTIFAVTFTRRDTLLLMCCLPRTLLRPYLQT